MKEAIMQDNLLIAAIAAGSAIIGSITGGLINYYSSKKSSDREDRRRREELERKTAEERLNKLYIPLIKMMSPSPPYDDGIHFDRQGCIRIIEIIKNNEMLASPELMRKYYSFTEYFYNDQDEIHRDLELELFNIVDSEYKELKYILGYGSILKIPSKGKLILISLLAPVGKIVKAVYNKINNIYFLWRIRNRGKRLRSK
jgi:hypothetical protein